MFRFNISSTFLNVVPIVREQGRFKSSVWEILLLLSPVVRVAIREGSGQKKKWTVLLLWSASSTSFHQWMLHSSASSPPTVLSHKQKRPDGRKQCRSPLFQKGTLKLVFLIIRTACKEYRRTTLSSRTADESNSSAICSPTYPSALYKLHFIRWYFMGTNFNVFFTHDLYFINK